MTIFQAIILGIIQGFGEFLPISSSGHLVIAPWLFQFSDPGLAFDVALHFGTLLAVITYFWRDWLNIIKDSFLYIFSEKKNYFQPQVTNLPHRQTSLSDQKTGYQLLIILIIATIPGALAGYLLEGYAETVFRNPLLVAFNLIFFGLVLFLLDKIGKKDKTMEHLNKKDSFFIGFFQALAIVPGVSRSGSTIIAGLFLGFTRTTAAKFSFLISAPIIFGATVLKAPDFFDSPITTVEIVGIISATVSGFLAIWGMMKFIEKINYAVFFWYRLGLAILIISLYLCRLA